MFDEFYLYVPLLRENGTFVRCGFKRSLHHVVVECTRPKSKHPLFQFSAETYLTIAHIQDELTRKLFICVWKVSMSQIQTGSHLKLSKVKFMTRCTWSLLTFQKPARNKIAKQALMEASASYKQQEANIRISQSNGSCVSALPPSVTAIFDRLLPPLSSYKEIIQKQHTKAAVCEQS